MAYKWWKLGPGHSELSRNNNNWVSVCLIVLSCCPPCTSRSRSDFRVNYNIITILHYSIKRGNFTFPEEEKGGGGACSVDCLTHDWAKHMTFFFFFWKGVFYKHTVSTFWRIVMIVFTQQYLSCVCVWNGLITDCLVFVCRRHADGSVKFWDASASQYTTSVCHALSNSFA